MEQENKEAVNDQSSPNEISTSSGEVDKTIKAKLPGWVKISIFISLLVSCAAAGGVFVFWSQQQQYQQQYSVRMTSVQEEIQVNKHLSTAKGKELDTLKKRLTSVIEDASTQRQQMQSKFKKMQGLLAEQNSQLQLIASSDPADWLLAEAEYLLRAANQRLLMSGDTDGAKALLMAADKIIQELDDVAMFSVRQSLAEDIAVLAAVENIDQEGVFARLSALSKMLDELPLIEGLENKAEEQVEDGFNKTNESDSTLVELKARFFKGFKEVMNMFEIKYHDYSVEPLLPPKQHFYLTQNIRLMFNQAKSALLSGQQNVYTSSLSNAQDWLTKYFQLSGVAIKSVLTGIDELRTLNISQPSLDISRSFRSLKKYNEKNRKLLSIVELNSELNSEARVEIISEAKPQEEEVLITPSADMPSTVTSAVSSSGTGE